MKKGFTVWLTGLSGSGKSTIAQMLSEFLLPRHAEILDGDDLRTYLSKGLGFSKEDRDNHILRVGYIAHLLTRNGIAVISAVISPYRVIRNANRRLIGDFIEVYINASLETCIKRDTKGLYKKALLGEIKNFTGVSDPYQPPKNPEVICYTGNETVEESTLKIIDKLRKMGYI